MAPTFILGNDYLSLDSVHLGSLVINKGNPQEDYFPHPSAEVPIPPVKINVKEDKDVTSNADNIRDKSFIERFMEYVSLRLTKQHSRVSGIRTECVKEYVLDNSGEYFRNIIKHTGTKEWIERAYQASREICLLVGFRTLRDAVITEYEKEVTSASVEVGIREISAGGSVNWMRDNAIKRKGIAHGEQVFAVMYRKVKVTYHKVDKHKVLTTTLKEGQWKVLTTHRQAQTGETVDVLEAEIIEPEERDKFDFDDDDDGEEWTKVEDEKGDFYL